MKKPTFVTIINISIAVIAVTIGVTGVCARPSARVPDRICVRGMVDTTLALRDTTPKKQIPVVYDFSSLSYTNSVYFSAGYGYPMGVRTELGYNFNEAISLGLAFHLLDTWNRVSSATKSSDGILAVTLRMHAPHISTSFIPYLLISTGGELELFGHSDSFLLFHVGVMIPIAKGIHVRTEVGPVRTSEYLGGGGGFLGPSTPVKTYESSYMGVQGSLEVDLAHIF